MNTATSKIARILRAPEETIARVEMVMTRATDKTGVLERIVQENERRMDAFLKTLGVTQRTAEAIYAAEMLELKKHERFLFHYLDSPDPSRPETLKVLVETGVEITGRPKGFFLKHEVAKSFLIKSPPPNIMRAFDVSNVEAMFMKCDWREIFAALRFVETRDWMNERFLTQYKTLKPSDFEERPVEVVVLGTQWLRIAAEFVTKKHHNVSHLKELGVIFIVPIRHENAGEILRVFTLYLHYLYEVQFYSRLFARFAGSSDFATRVISLLRGDVGQVAREAGDKLTWMIVQRYLAKEDPNDPRLFVPHVNPEAMHWEHAEDALANFARSTDGFRLDIWRGLDWVGDFYPSEREGELLVSFDLIDMIMTLVDRKDLAKYLYHHQEALWNKIYKEYVGKTGMEEQIIAQFERGQLTV